MIRCNLQLRVIGRARAWPFMWSSTSMARSQFPILPYTSTSVLYVTTFGVQLSCAQTTHDVMI